MTDDVLMQRAMRIIDQWREDGAMYGGREEAERLYAALEEVRRGAREEAANIAAKLDPDALTCVGGHDRCGYGPDENCQYCENRSPIAASIRSLQDGET